MKNNPETKDWESGSWEVKQVWSLLYLKQTGIHTPGQNANSKQHKAFGSVHEFKKKFYIVHKTYIYIGHSIFGAELFLDELLNLIIKSILKI